MSKNEVKKEFKFKTFDEHGNINNDYVKKNFFWSTVGASATIGSSFIGHTYLKAQEVNYPMFDSPSTFVNSIKAMSNGIYQGINLYGISFTASAAALGCAFSYFAIKKYIEIRFNAEMQRVLSLIGFSNYKLVNEESDKNEQLFVIEPDKGQSMNIESFQNKNEDLCQLFKRDNVQIARHGANRIKFQFSDLFPTIEDLKGLDISKFLKKGKIFMGVGLPMIGEKYKKSDLIKGKYLARYVDFKDLPVAMANLGSAGGGKSVSMSQYLQSIFYNFDLIEEFIMVDFKGAIEAQPLEDMENRLKTGKIKVLGDSRKELYKVLKKLDFINKSRMAYLRKNKMKKFKEKYIIIVFDELAEILDYEPTDKEEKKIQNEIKAIIESLKRTARSQHFLIWYSTQSFLSTASGLSSGMKNNTKLRVAHQLGSSMQVGSIKEVADLMELGITSPTKYDVGRNFVSNDQTNEIYEVRSLYVPDNFTETITIEKTEPNIEFQEEMKAIYLEKYEELKKDREELKQKSKKKDDDEEIYSLEDIIEDLGLADESFEIKPTLDLSKKEVEESKEEVKTEPKEEPRRPKKIDLTKSVKFGRKDDKKVSTDDILTFIESTEDMDVEAMNKNLSQELNDKDIDETDKFIEEKLKELKEKNIINDEKVDVDKFKNDNLKPKSSIDELDKFMMENEN